MRVTIQRVTEASVTVAGNTVAKIQQGLLLLLGVCDEDTQEDITWLSHKIIKLRVFNDAEGIMNKSIQDIDGEIIVVSQFTLYAKTKKGNRPSYTKAAKPPIAIPLYEAFIAQIESDLGKKVTTGVFGAAMKVSLVNDGPVTIIIDTKNKE